MRPAFVWTGLILLGATFSGCIEPAPTPPGWERDAETGVSWRLLTDDEMELWRLEEYHRVYVSRVPGVVADLRSEDEVRFPVRVFGGFLDAHLSFDREEHDRIEGDRPRDSTTRWFHVEAPWDHAWLSLPGAFDLRASSVDGWQYRVTTPFAEWEPIDDIRPDDLITRARPPCAEWGGASENSTAVCLRYEAPEGH